MSNCARAVARSSVAHTAKCFVAHLWPSFLPPLLPFTPLFGALFGHTLRQPKSPLPRFVPTMTDEYLPYTGGQLAQVLGRQRTMSTSTSYRTAAADWNHFYRQNSVNAYKDRHYILREFGPLRACLSLIQAGRVPSDSAEPFSLCEVGCGVGNAVLPLLRTFYDSRTAASEGGRASSSQFRVLACDVSAVAVRLLQDRLSQERFSPEVCAARVLDISLQPIPRLLSDGRVSSDVAADADGATRSPRAELKYDFVSMIFVLCSVAPERHVAALRHVAEALAPSNPNVDVTTITAGADNLMKRPRRHTTRAVATAESEDEEDEMETRSVVQGEDNSGDEVTDQDDSADGDVLRCMSSHSAETRQGYLFFRDYCAEDLAHQRFAQRDVTTGGAPNAAAEASTFRRTNGTLSHFFTIPEVTHLFDAAGLRILSIKVVDRTTCNRRDGTTMDRRFIQAIAVAR